MDVKVKYTIDVQSPQCGYPTFFFPLINTHSLIHSLESHIIDAVPSSFFVDLSASPTKLLVAIDFTFDWLRGQLDRGNQIIHMIIKLNMNQAYV